MMTIRQAAAFGAQKLKQAKIPSAILDAEVLLSYVLKKDKEFIFINPEFKLNQAQAKKYKWLIKRRAKFEPVAYLTGQKEFYGLNFLVNKNVLIPRPETELLVEEAINLVKKSEIFNAQSKIVIADIGTGSGAIAIALKKYLPKTKIIATELSPSALNVAQKNATRNKVAIKFIKTDLLNGLKDQIDLIAANLPYVPTAEKKIKNIFSASLKYEPAQALYSGPYGLKAYEKLFGQIRSLKNKPKVLVCEIGSTFVAKTKTLAKKYFPSAKITLKKDLCGKNRLMIADLRLHI